MLTMFALHMVPMLLSYKMLNVVYCLLPNCQICNDNKDVPFLVAVRYLCML